MALLDRVPRAAIYCRVSTAKQEDEGTSLDTQEAACRRYAAEHGYHVDEDLIFRETYSGGQFSQRPKLTALRQIIREHQIDAVIFYAIDRLTRKQADLGRLVSETKDRDVKLCCVTEEFEDSALGRFILNALAFKAEMELEDIRERTMRGQRARIDSGKPMPGNRPPYGYSWADADKTRLVEDPLNARIVRRIFDEILSGRSARSLAAQLTSEGIPTPTGRELWTQPTIGGIVRHPVYVGDLYAFRYVRVKGKKGKPVLRLRPEAEWVLLPDVAPALASREDAAEASRRLTRNKSMSPRNNHNPEAALLRGGYAVCGYCGKIARAVNTTERGTLYRCNPSNVDRYGCRYYGVPASAVDAAVWSEVSARLLDPDIIAAEVANFLDQDAPVADDLAAIDRRLEVIARQQQKLAKSIAVLDDEEASAPLEAELRSLARQATHLRADRDVISRLREERQQVRQRLTDMASWCRTVAGNLERLTYDQKRLALDAFSIRVNLWAKGDRNPPWQITAFPDILTRSSFWSNRCRT